jgi:hypothetical protein
MSDSLIPPQGGSNKCAEECCICGGVVNLMNSQALALSLPTGEVIRVRFHQACYQVSPQKANDAILVLYHTRTKEMYDKK